MGVSVTCSRESVMRMTWQWKSLWCNISMKDNSFYSARRWRLWGTTIHSHSRFLALVLSFSCSLFSLFLLFISFLFLFLSRSLLSLFLLDSFSPSPFILSRSLTSSRSHVQSHCTLLHTHILHTHRHSLIHSHSFSRSLSTLSRSRSRNTP